MRRFPKIKKVINPIPAERIRREVLSYFNITDKELRSRKRKRGIVFPRQVLTYCLWHYTNLPQREISPYIGTDRSMIKHSVDQVAGLCLHYREIRKQLIELETKIDQP